MLEHIILLKDVLEKIDGFLHGFRRGLLCEMQLWYDILADKDKFVHAAVLDFTSAFDRVFHVLLVEKLLKLRL